MCTAMVTQTSQGDIYFGRTMDFSYPLEPELYVVPKGYQWNNIMNTHQVRNRYRFMGIGQDISPVVFADGVNEMGSMRWGSGRLSSTSPAMPGMIPRTLRIRPDLPSQPWSSPDFS